VSRLSRKCEIIDTSQHYRTSLLDSLHRKIFPIFIVKHAIRVYIHSIRCSKASEEANVELVKSSELLSIPPSPHLYPSHCHFQKECEQLVYMNNIEAVQTSELLLQVIKTMNHSYHITIPCPSVDQCNRRAQANIQRKRGFIQHRLRNC
jgi:hypothetical protein